MDIKESYPSSPPDYLMNVNGTNLINKFSGKKPEKRNLIVNWSRSAQRVNMQLSNSTFYDESNPEHSNVTSEPSLNQEILITSKGA